MDQVIKALAHEGRIRIIVAKTTDLVEKARVIHDTEPTASAAFGRLLSMAAIMGTTLKHPDEKITCSVRGDGPIVKMMAVANQAGQVKGFIGQPHVHFINETTKKLDVARAIGAGTLEVVKDMRLKSNFTSTIHLISSEIGEDFAQFFTVSEQTPSAVSVGVLVGENKEILASGAIVIQMMPGATEEDILTAEHVVKHLKPVSTIIAEGQNPKEITQALFEDVVILDEIEIQYVCDCSRHRTRSALKLVDILDLKDMLLEDEQAEIVCQFCKEKYLFDREDLAEIIKEKIAFDENKKHSH
jgi:molecular chaperone Hsp33